MKIPFVINRSTDQHLVSLTFYPLGFFFCRLLIFFQNQLFQKFLSGIPSECQTDWIQIRPDILLQTISADDSHDHDQLFQKNSFRNTIKVSNRLDPDEPSHFVGPDLVPNCLQKISADNTGRYRLKLQLISIL